MHVLPTKNSFLIRLPSVAFGIQHIIAADEGIDPSSRGSKPRVSTSPLIRFISNLYQCFADVYTIQQLHRFVNTFFLFFYSDFSG